MNLFVGHPVSSLPLILLFALVTATSASACTMPIGATDLTRQLVAKINQERTRAGVRPFLLSTLLSDVAQRHACENASQNRLSHRGTDGSSPGARALRVGYDFRRITENVALGHATPDDVLRAWLFSSSHRQNIFDPRTAELGVAVALGHDGRVHWVMNGGVR